mmetsp:Transcript_14739/g.36922  ORF Transcript_14739/g.36922 Transcript_14739/m.36922 type:complete len:295 (+) Transcript_14739:1523-2407(+)
MAIAVSQQLSKHNLALLVRQLRLAFDVPFVVVITAKDDFLPFRFRDLRLAAFAPAHLIIAAVGAARLVARLIVAVHSRVVPCNAAGIAVNAVNATSNFRVVFRHRRRGDVVPRSRLLAVRPRALVVASVRPRVRSLPILDTASPLAVEPVSISPDVRSTSLHLARDPLAAVRASVHPTVLTRSVRQAVFPDALVDIPGDVRLFSKTVPSVSEPRSHVQASVGAFEFSHAADLPFEPLSFERRPARPAVRPDAVPESVEPLAFVGISVARPSVHAVSVRHTVNGSVRSSVDVSVG